MDLFQNQQTAFKEPLALKLAPKTLNDFVGQSHLVGGNKALRLALEGQNETSFIFFGPPGCGKTALARVLANQRKMKCQEISCVVHGVPKIREVLNKASYAKEANGENTLLVLDEIHHLNRSQQDILLPYMETGAIILVGVTTENPFFYIHKAILSRALVFEFKSLSEQDLGTLLERTLATLARDQKTPRLDESAKTYLVSFAAGDARRLINALEFLANVECGISNTESLNEERIQELLGKKQLLYDKKEDYHYDLASAFIKAMRGSDPDAALYWMVRMLEGGEDPRFIARRILILASEDIGNADPQALVIAQSAFYATEVLGLPECALALAQAAIYMAAAPKSNASYLALKATQQEVRNGAPREVPLALKDSNLDTALGHGQGYQYPHDHPQHFAKQSYWPNPKVFYEPTLEGWEAKIRERLEKLWNRKFLKTP